MAEDIEEIPAHIKARIKKFEKKLLKMRRDFLVTLVTNLARATPVDTSRALSNWEIHKNLGGFYYGTAHIEGKWGSTAHASIALVHAAAKRADRGVPIEKTMYIGNAAPYIVRLNQGYSAQQPRGVDTENPAENGVSFF